MRRPPLLVWSHTSIYLSSLPSTHSYTCASPIGTTGKALPRLVRALLTHPLQLWALACMTDPDPRFRSPNPLASLAHLRSVSRSVTSLRHARTSLTHSVSQSVTPSVTSLSQSVSEGQTRAWFKILSAPRPSSSHPHHSDHHHNLLTPGPWWAAGGVGCGAGPVRRC